MDRVGVVFGGPSPEHDVSILTGLQAARELAAHPSVARSVTALYWSKAGEWFQVEPTSEAAAFRSGVPKGATPVRLVVAAGAGFTAHTALGRTRALELEAVVNCCHGGPGEDGSLQGALDIAGIPHAGPSVASAAVGMDKLTFGSVVAACGLPTLPRSLLAAGTPVGFDGPYIVKPRFGGSSIGIQVVADADTARALVSSSVHLRRGAVIEPYRADLHDINIAIRCWPELAFSAIERPIRPPGAVEIFGYRDKYVPGEGMVSAPRELPAVLDPLVEKKIRESSAVVAQACGVRGVARLDFLTDGTEVYVNEINTIPGSLARHLWVDPPLEFVAILEAMLQEAVRRPSAAYSSDGADGSVLASATSIASKLS